MQHDNNIENKLKQQEAIEQPDVSQMDAHWQQMAGMLQPAALPLKKGWPKWMLNTLSAAAVVLLIGAAVLYVSSKKNNEGEKMVKQNEVAAQENPGTNSVPATSLAVATDTAIAINATAAFHKPTINLSLINDSLFREGLKQWTEEDSLLGTVKLHVAPCGNCDDKKDDAVVTNAERQMKLQNLFVQLEKQEQHFTIDNSRDTLLQFEEGTALLVPANSFGGMNGVELTAKEFYKTSDIVLNLLNTESDKGQLETGGMLYLQASCKGNEVKIDKSKPLILFIADTSNNMKGMQLFNGKTNEPEQKAASNIISKKINEEVERSDRNSLTRDTTANDNSSFVNWVPQNQYFSRKKFITQVRVLNIVDQPYRIKINGKRQTAYFIIGEEIPVEKEKLKRILKEKYGYNRIKLTPSFRNAYYYETGKMFSEHSRSIGDSVWMDKTLADSYNLTATSTRQIIIEQNSNSAPYITSINDNADSRKGKIISTNIDSLAKRNYYTYQLQSENLFNNIQNAYGVNLTKLGWINCDRFYTDSRKKIQFKVDLADSAANYYTMLVFDKLNSMMTGYINGNEVAFQNIPVGEPVKIISIGINKKGETVYSVTHTTTSEEGLKGLQFQSTSAPELKTALSKYDN